MADSTVTTPAPQSNLQTSGVSSDAFLSAVQGKLLDQSGIISSSNSNLQSQLQAAISGVQTAADKTDQATTSSYDRQIADAQQTGADSIVNGRAAGSGGVLNITALRALTETTDKSLKDLEQRKQELILQNDSAAASKVADLQFQSLKFQQDAQQQTFANLLGMANYGQQAQQNQLAQKAQTFQEQQALSSVALKYGLTVQPGDTLASVTTRAMPLASKEEALGLAKMQADINSANAQAAKYMSDVNSAKSGLDALSASVLAGNYLSGDPTSQTAILTSILNSKNPKDMATFQGALKESQDAKQKAIDDSIPQLATMKVSDIQKQLAASNQNFSQSDVTNILAKVADYQSKNNISSSTTFTGGGASQSALSKILNGQRAPAPKGYHYDIFGMVAPDKK